MKLLQKSIEYSINISCGVVAKNLNIFDPIFKLILWQNQNSYEKTYYFQKSNICKTELMLFYNFSQNLNLFLSYKHLTLGSSGHYKYWHFNLTLKILVLTDFVDQNTQTVHCKWLCC